MLHRVGANVVYPYASVCRLVGGWGVLYWMLSVMVGGRESEGVDIREEDMEVLI